MKYSSHTLQNMINIDNKNGVTLIELLVAIVIVGIIVASIYTAFDCGKNSWQVGETMSQRYQNARGILETMSREIATAMVDTVSVPYHIYCIGKADAFYFTGPLGSLAVTDNLYRAGYWWKSSSEKGEKPGVLVRGFEEREDSKPHYTFAGLDNQPLGVHVKDLDFRYYNGSSWASDWNSGNDSNELPQAIEIKLTVEDNYNIKSREFTTVVSIPSAE